MTTLSRFLLMFLVATLAACGGGGSGGGGGGGDPAPVDGDPGGGDPGGGDPADVLSGRAAKGVIRDATVTASVWNGLGWVTLATTETDAEGRFELDIDSETDPVRISVTATASSEMRCDAVAGCGGTEFGGFVPLPEGFVLNTIVPGGWIDPEGEIAVTPLTHLAARWAQDIPGGLDNAVAELALSRVAELFDLADDFALQLPVDVADTDEVAAASDMNLRHALFSAAFAELAEAEGIALAELTAGAAEMFSLLGGQVLLRSGELTVAEIEQMITDLGGDPETLLADLDLDDMSLAGLDALLAGAVAVATGINDDNRLDALIADLNTEISGIGEDVLSELVGLVNPALYDSNDFDRGMLVLDDLDHYLDLADSLDSGSGEDFAWLYADEDARNDTEGAVTALAEALNFAVAAIPVAAGRTSVVFAANYDLETGNSWNVVEPGGVYASMHRSGSGSNADFEVRVDGQRHGQVVDLTFDIDHAGEVINDQLLTITIDGSIGNPTSALDLDMVLELDLADNDMTALQARLADIGLGDVFDPEGTEAEFTVLLEELLGRLHAVVSLSGEGSFTRVSDDTTMYSFSGMDLEILYNACVVIDNPLCQVNEGPVLDILLADGQRTNADGDQISALADEDRFHLTLDEPSSLDIAYGSSRASGFPDMEVRAGGVLNGAEDLLEQLGDAIGEGEVDFEEIDFEALLAGLDIGVLTLDGELELTILDDVAGTLVYTVSPGGEGLDISLPNSTENALSLRLAGAAGYLYADATLVGTFHPELNDNGLMIALVDGEQRSYSAGPLEFSDQDALLEWLESLIGQLFPEEEPV